MEELLYVCVLIGGIVLVVLGFRFVLRLVMQWDLKRLKQKLERLEQNLPEHPTEQMAMAAVSAHNFLDRAAFCLESGRVNALPRFLDIAALHIGNLEFAIAYAGHKQPKE